MRLPTISLLVFFLAIALGCGFTRSGIEEGNLYWYIDENNNAQSSPFRWTVVNDSVFMHDYFSLGKPREKLQSDTFKLVNKELFLRNQGQYQLLLTARRFEEKLDTTCDFRGGFNCFVPHSSYFDGTDSIYFFKRGFISFYENFGLELHPKLGIVAFIEGREKLRLSKFK